MRRAAILFSMLFYTCLVKIIVITSYVPQALQSPEVEEVTTDTINTSTAQYNADTDVSTYETSTDNGQFSIEILRIIVPPGIGNVVKLVWGRKLDDLNLNFTYGLHYGVDGEDLTSPKLTTNNLSAVIENLKFCTKYNFAVSVAGNENKINSNNIRSVVTYIDRLAPPENLQVDFEPREDPCLLIRWSASCANIGQAIGYVISAFEQSTSRYTIVTLPASKKVDFVYHFKAKYGARYDIKVSTNFPGSQATDIVTYKVPSFLQPYKVKVTSNPDGAFLIYWSEPFVPYYIDRVYYEVYIYKGTNITTNYEKYYVTRPALVYKGNESEYTFSVGLVSYDQQYRSLLTDPIVANLNGDVHEINLS